MPTELPITGSLSATDLSQRLAEIADLGRHALVNAHIQPLEAQLRFASGAGVRDRVAAVAAAESRCCAFLTMGVTDEPNAVVLTNRAPEDAQLMLAELVDTFRAHSRVAS